MSNFLSRLVAKQMGSGEGSQSMVQSMIQPRPIARFESVVAPATPVMPQLEEQNTIEPIQPPITFHHPPVDVQPDSQIHSTQPLIQPNLNQTETDNPIQHQSTFNLSNSSLQAASASTPAFRESSLNSLNSVSPTISSTSEGNHQQQSSYFETSQPSQLSSPVPPSLTPNLSPATSPQPIATPPLVLPPVSLLTMPPLTASSQRPTIRETADRLPTPPLLIPPAPPQTLPPQTQPSEPASAVPPAAPAPTIQVTIGRIEVRANSPSVRSAPAPRPATRMSLEDYLQRRTQGRKP